MIHKISSKQLSKMDAFGNKGKFLCIMKNKGVNVPDGLLLDSEEFKAHLEFNGIKEKINEELTNLSVFNLKEKSKKLQNTLDKTEITDKLKNTIILKLEEHKSYAVRSSSTKEDLENLSFAGQYETILNVKGVKNIEKAIIDCYKSLFSETSLSYMLKNKVNINEAAMGIVIQEMVNADYSGICFTSNPLTGIDTEMVIEIAKGLGENIVSGRVKPEQYLYNWKTKEAYIDKNKTKLLYAVSNKLVTLDEIVLYGEAFLEVQKIFGYPCDIEFAVKDKKLYILQARKITDIEYDGYKDIWTTADFRDGVSATTCKQFMWSLYEYIWEFSLRKFLLDSKILSKDEVDKKLGDMFFGRCYWNLSVVKLAMSKIVGYKEREFDKDFGIGINYEGDGHTTKASVKSLIKIANIALAQKSILNERNKNHEIYKKELLEEYDRLRCNIDKVDDIEKEWYKLTQKTYLKSESIYFWQIFINTIHQSLYKDKMLKHVSEEEYLVLLSSLDNISHMLPFYDMWNLSRLIRDDDNALKYWKESSIENIKTDILNNETYSYIDNFLNIVEKYGYHSDKELDVSYPCYFEDFTSLIITLKNTIELTDEFSPKKDKERNSLEYRYVLSNLKNKLNDKKFNKINNDIQNMRNMLWWREEYRDISTRFYYIIRIYTLKLAEKLVKDEVIDSIDDIWFVGVTDLWDFIDNIKNREDIRNIVKANKDYYMAFKNYTSSNELGGGYIKESNTNCSIKGIGANKGKVTGTARVIKDLSEIDKLKQGDILVTKFTDTGWTPKFAIISGIVTEYGGVLCHAAIVSREYGIPAIVSCDDVLNKVKDGDTITINGSTGEVIVNT